MADVVLDQVVKGYGGRVVVPSLNLRVRHSACFTLLGPSGCGKTVILRMIAGFEQPDSGEIRIGEELVACPAKNLAAPPEARNIAVVFQDYAVWPHKSVYENVVYPLQLQNAPSSEAAERVKRAIEQVNLGGLEQRMPSQLSGGQQQRVALARALVARPSVMLLDEPLCNLDAGLREEMRFEIKELQRTLGATILYVTHDQEIGLAIADVVAVMDKQGRIRQSGPPEEVFEHPVDAYVFQFLGVANFLPVDVESGVARLSGSGRALPWPKSSPPAVSGPGLAGCRPTDIGLLESGQGLAATVTRRTFLGATIDYRVELDGRELRVTVDAHREPRAFEPGAACGLEFHDLHCFPRDSEEAQL